ncbi:MAG: DUF1501 domain-containing protein [Fuerstiella sp.]|nr:DUF1501 domain-containing protein [Fuerstiella sp.]MCP4785080.1 DUF1501 domain-containing protein [Fuerstiella sp.]MCP4859200.1 DUF1501 domain-containing protein [Fuerstiella sp.]
MVGLIRDLKQRGLLEGTLNVWESEFGRGIIGQTDFSSPEAGSDHHHGCFTILFAGDEIKPGMTFGATDDFSYNVADDSVHVHDLRATILQQLSIDHRRLTCRFQ